MSGSVRIWLDRRPAFFVTRMNVAANSAIFIFYRRRFHSLVPAVWTPELRSGYSTYARMLAVDWLQIQPAEMAAQPWIAAEAFVRRRDV